MRLRPISSVLLSSFATFAFATAPAAMESKQAAAQWLSQQLHSPIEAAQILVSPAASTLEGCTILHSRIAPTGATALSLRCPEHALPQLLLLNIAVPVAVSPRLCAAAAIVRAGAALQADWRTDSMHAQLGVVALDSGAAGAEIRVRIPHSNRIMRARILSAHTVAIVVAES
jgi:hypothetical protein